MITTAVLLCVLICSGLRCVRSESLAEAGLLACELVEEGVSSGLNGGPETQNVRRKAALLLARPGREADTAQRLQEAQQAGVVTFLATGSAVDVTRHVPGGTEQLQCEIRRYSTGGIQVPWPREGTAGPDSTWFTCTLRHSTNEFIVTAFLLYPSPAPQQPIGNADTLNTSVAMVVLTRTPTVQAGLLQDARLDCGFAVDHAQADVTVEWRFQHRGERRKLFSYSRRSGRAETEVPGATAAARDVSRGDASLRLSAVKVKSEGTYVCSVYVPPLYGSHDVQLQIMESPRVSLSVGTALALQEEEEQKVVCEITGYYPLDVQVDWLREQEGGGRLPQVIKNILFTSHRHHTDGTYSISAFFILHPSLADRGARYTCRVSHVSLRTPIRKSFTLTVTERLRIGSILFGIFVAFIVMMLLLVLVILLRYLHSARREAKKKKPY